MHTDANTRLVSSGAITLSYDPRYTGIRFTLHHCTIYLQADEALDLLEKVMKVGTTHFGEAWGARVKNTFSGAHKEDMNAQ